MEDLGDKIQEKIDEKLDKKMDSVDQFVRRRNSGSWIFAIVLILLGVIFLLQEMQIPLLNNWWALFIMIPAFVLFASSWNIYQQQGRKWSAAVTGPIVGGLILMMISLIFLLDLQWKYMWPVILIIVGISVFINSFLR